MRAHSVKKSLYFYKLVVVALRIGIPDERNSAQAGAAKAVFSADKKKRRSAHKRVPVCLRKERKFKKAE